MIGSSSNYFKFSFIPGADFYCKFILFYLIIVSGGLYVCSESSLKASSSSECSSLIYRVLYTFLNELFFYATIIKWDIESFLIRFLSDIFFIWVIFTFVSARFDNFIFYVDGIPLIIFAYLFFGSSFVLAKGESEF